MSAEQLDLLDVLADIEREDAAPVMVAPMGVGGDVPADLTCPSCGVTERNEFLLRNNHGGMPTGECIARYLTRNHVRSFVRSLVKIDAGEPIKNQRGRALTDAERADLRSSVRAQLVERVERARVLGIEAEWLDDIAGVLAAEDEPGDLLDLLAGG